MEFKLPVGIDVEATMYCGVINGSFNMEDLVLARRPGAIVRFDGDPRDAVLRFVGDEVDYGFVAGMIDGDEK